MLRRGGEVRRALDRRGARADDADALTGQVLQLLAGVGVVPPAGIERVPAKTPEAWNAGELGFGLIPVGHGDELRPHLIPAVRPDDPAGNFRIPTYLMHIGLQARVGVQIVVLGD